PATLGSRRSAWSARPHSPVEGEGMTITLSCSRSGPAPPCLTRPATGTRRCGPGYREVAMTSPLATVPAVDNQVPAEVDARLPRLLENLVRQRGVHHANLAVTDGAGKHRWAAASGPAGEADHQLRPDTPFFTASVT